MNFIDAELKADGKTHYLEVNGDRLAIPAENAAKAQGLKQYIGRTVKLGIRPEDIYDDEQFISANPGAVISTSVDVSELMGNEVYLYLKYGDNILTARVAPTTTSRRGDNVKVGINMKKIHLFDVDTEEAVLN